MSDNNINEHDIVENKYTVGPGIKHAILWGSFIITFLLGMLSGWYMCNEHYRNDASTKQVEILQDDTRAEFEMIDQENAAEVIIRYVQEDRNYESNCGNMLIRDVTK